MTPVAAIAIGTTIASTLFQVSSSRKAAKAEERALQAKAAAQKAQALELLDRNEYNIGEMYEEAEVYKADQISGFAAHGVALGFGTSLRALEQTQEKLMEAATVARREANFKADMLRAGADIDTKLSSDVRSTAKTQQAGIFLSGVSNVATAAGAK